ncbi:family 10 glycosylhydrolase [Paucibacter sp. APW11]|uniref:Family 10 glycosylhydrolase n=1 Tax=Roseateles aquae TaxID=3077235 RepID=A0ABU3PHJ6_9BURK|nr:family 10 glycosylhydrolase [Paucibacter sp. APW11]MDT9001842.1 family 10 glycosylhydrolase [Paucibacter sp. APW11]
MSNIPTRRQALQGLAGLAAIGLAGCAAPHSRGPGPGPGPGPRLRTAPELAAAAPAPAREFRAAWVATVANIDWPSRAGLSREQQIAEMLALLDRAQALRLNALILQVRNSADAIYPSALEPWSEVLSGVQGQDPGWDPLARWVDEAHARGIELHAWFNPYRARPSGARGPRAAGHLSQTRPDWVKAYGDQLWTDPGEPEAAAHTLAVIDDVLQRYAIDGVHIDDYFYPYPIKDASGSQELDFPDEPSWARYRAGGGQLARAEWRRDNVNRLVAQLSQQVRRSRPGMLLGISPFGLPRPDLRPAGISGFSQYDKLYADVERWLAEGWLDYLAPQLYWPRAQAAQAFAPLLQAWRGLNPKSRHIWPGLFSSRINSNADSWQPDEILGQIALSRAGSDAPGHAHFSMVALAQNRRGLADALLAGPYAEPALPPAMPWLAEDRATPPPPTAPLLEQRADGSLRLHWQGSAGAHLLWLLHDDGRWRWQRLWGREALLPAQGWQALALAALDTAGREGPRQAWRRA